MPKQFRYKGRFAKKKVVEKRLKAVALMNQGKKEKSKQQSANSPKENQLCTDPSLVNLNKLGKNLHCGQCHKVLSLDNVTKEKRSGLTSVLDVNCKDCLIVTKVSANKLHKPENTARHSDKTGITSGSKHADVGCAGLDKILACVDAPISDDLYRHYKRKYGPMIEKAEKESYERRARIQQQLVIEKIEQLCKKS